jgi:hypothetical protein
MVNRNWMAHGLRPKPKSGHAEARPGGEAGRSSRREPKRSLASGVADLRRFSMERF